MFVSHKKAVKTKRKRSYRFEPCKVAVSNTLKVKREDDFAFLDRVYHREVYRLQLSQVAGRLTQNLPPPSLPVDPNYTCSPSTFRLYVIPLAYYHEEKSETLDWKKAGQLQHILSVKDNLNSQSIETSISSSIIRCNVNYKCEKCSREFSSNCEKLEYINGEYLDPFSLQPPSKSCSRCWGLCSPFEKKIDKKEVIPAIEPFEFGKHAAWREHSPDWCVNCMISETWCAESKNKFKIKPSMYDANVKKLERAGVLVGDTDWVDHGDGLEISDITYENERFRVLITPSIYCLPAKMAELARLECREAPWLIYNIAPHTLSSFRDVLVALNFQSHASVRGVCGPWMNKLIDLFIANETKVDPELIDGFKRFPLPVIAGSDPAMYDNWMTAYHGTGIGPAALVFIQGGLSRPNDHGRGVAHGQCGSLSNNSIYTSPSKEVAGFPTYSTVFTLKPEERSKKPEKFGQIVFEVKVRPGYRVQESTLSRRRHWPADLRIDPRFESFEGLEWIHESSADLVLTAILVRQFGKGSEEFGQLNCQVSSDYKKPLTALQGPEYHWSDLRAESYRRKGGVSHKVVMPSKHHCCAYIRQEGDSRVLASIMWKRPSSRYVSAVDYNDVEEATAQFKMLEPMLHRDYCERYPLTTVFQKAPTVVPAVAAEQPSSCAAAVLVYVYLCAESKLVEAILRDGFTAYVRSNIAVESSKEAARRGYKEHHRHEPCVTFKLLLTPQLQAFRNERGSLRITSNYIPPHGLKLVSMP